MKIAPLFIGLICLPIGAFATAQSGLVKFQGQAASIKFQGQKISKSDEAIYGKIGLKAGDVVIFADHRPMNSPSDAMDLYNKIQSKKSFKILIERNGQYEIFTAQAQ